MLDAREITELQDRATLRWHEGVAVDSPEELMVIVVENHRANFKLWHEEDKARDPDASDSEIAKVKRAIDSLNQQRNDLVEAIDDCVLQQVPEQNAQAPLHSETPGMMIDRLSIQALKIYHTREEAARESATPEHRLRNARRLQKLEEQREDLARCLNDLWTELQNGSRRFKLYRQMKMYNDPELNPAVYSRKGS